MNNEKTKSVIAYLFGLIGGIIVLVMKDTEKNTKIHAAQSITIFLGYTIIKVIYSFVPFGIPFFSSILNVLYLICVIIGIGNVLCDKEPDIPVIGDIAQTIFKKQIEEANK